jgi:hypothetical protein
MHVRVNGVQLFFDVEGAKLVPDGPAMREKPTLLLLHGGPGFDHSIYRPAYSALADVEARTVPQRPGTWRNGATTCAPSATSWASLIQLSWACLLAGWSRWLMPPAIRPIPPSSCSSAPKRLEVRIGSDASSCSSGSAGRKSAPWRAPPIPRGSGAPGPGLARCVATIGLSALHAHSTRSRHGTPCDQPVRGAAMVYETRRRKRHVQHVPGSWPHPVSDPRARRRGRSDAPYRVPGGYRSRAARASRSL